MNKLTQARTAASIKTIAFPDGAEVQLRKLTAAHTDALNVLLASMGYGKQGGPDDTPAASSKLYAFIASKSIVGDDGGLAFDTEQGRDELLQFPFDDLKFLGEAAQEWSGLLPDEKAAPAKND